MDAHKRFHQLLKRGLSPLLRASGFKGSGNTFRRITYDRIDVVNVQGSRYGGQCCVNLAVHFAFLPSMGGGEDLDPMKFREYDCAFRDRLHETTESDHWWRYGATDTEAEDNVANLIDMYQRQGNLFFTKFEPFPEVFERITPAELDAGDCSKMPAAMTLVFAALTLARIMKHLGRREKCRAFAEVGLRHAGGAVGLEREFRQLSDM